MSTITPVAAGLAAGTAMTVGEVALAAIPPLAIAGGAAMAFSYYRKQQPGPVMKGLTTVSEAAVKFNEVHKAGSTIFGMFASVLKFLNGTTAAEKAVLAEDAKLERQKKRLELRRLEREEELADMRAEMELEKLKTERARRRAVEMAAPRPDATDDEIFVPEESRAAPRKQK